ncbi:MAG: hypothetical protein IRY85_06695 [Micromonosporaceae bacterium]|nr:hypothetical protein [Micromonosporaceae bacterium]
MTIAAWPRPAFQPTGRRAAFLLVAFADREMLSPPELAVAAPPSAPVSAVRVNLVQYADQPEWFDGWRHGPLRTVAAVQNIDMSVVDAATCCYVIDIDVDDPTDLTHLQLAWAVASSIAQAGNVTVLDVYAATWHAGSEVAALAPDRPFTIQHEISITAETEPVPGFGHAVHTRGMIKFGRPDLIAGVPADLIHETGQILNHLGRMLANGAVIEPGERFRIDGRRTLMATPYEPGGPTPDVNLANDAILLVDV